MPAAWNLPENETAASPLDSRHPPLPHNKTNPCSQRLFPLLQTPTPALVSALQGCWQIRTHPQFTQTGWILANGLQVASSSSTPGPQPG